MNETQDTKTGVKREDIKMRTGEDGPVLDIDGLELHLQISAYTEESFDTMASTVTTEIDSNGDFSWWLCYPEGDLDNYVEVVPTAGDRDE